MDNSIRSSDRMVALDCVKQSDCLGPLLASQVGSDGIHHVAVISGSTAQRKSLRTSPINIEEGLENISKGIEKLTLKISQDAETVLGEAANALEVNVYTLLPPEQPKGVFSWLDLQPNETKVQSLVYETVKSVEATRNQECIQLREVVQQKTEELKSLVDESLRSMKEESGSDLFNRVEIAGEIEEPITAAKFALEKAMGDLKIAPGPLRYAQDLNELCCDQIQEFHADIELVQLCRSNMDNAKKLRSENPKNLAKNINEVIRKGMANLSACSKKTAVEIKVAYSIAKLADKAAKDAFPDDLAAPSRQAAAENLASIKKLIESPAVSQMFQDAGLTLPESMISTVQKKATVPPPGKRGI